MSFTAIKLLSAAALPTALLVECATAGWLLRRWLIGRVLLGLGVLGLLLCLIVPVDAWALRPLEDVFPQVTEFPSHLDGIIVLGGSIDELTSLDRGTPTMTAAANRLTTFLILAKRYPAAKLVFTGGSGQIQQGVSTEAQFARILLQDLGLPPARVMFEDRSRTTAENAAFSRDLVQPKPGEMWALVTSASHMPRAVGAFRAVGWPVVAWPTAYLTRDNLTALAPSLGGKLERLDLAGHEWMGLLAYWLMGKTDSLFPIPSQG